MTNRLRIAFLGDGHIASVARTLLSARPYDIVPSIGRDDAVPGDVDLVIETATQQTARVRLPAVIGRGQDVLLLSVGALAHPDARATLAAGPGALMVCTGAVGGLDQVRALRVDGPLEDVWIESRKLPATLVQPWMDADLVTRLHAGDEEIVLDDDLATAVTARFPMSANVAASLALAADAWTTARARVIADPAAVRTRHTLHARGATGEVTVVVENEPSPERPRSSAVVARAVVRSVDDYARLRGFDAPAGITVL